MSPTRVPYGSWKSPITSGLLTSSGIGFSEIHFANGQLYWLESRPEEGGRVAVVRCSTEGKIFDVIPREFSARTRAHEYGGGGLLSSDTVLTIGRMWIDIWLPDSGSGANIGSDMGMVMGGLG